MESKKSMLEEIVMNPLLLAKAVGFSKLGDIHESWILDILKRPKKLTIQAHRGAYKNWQ